jgi:hypothetical protein
MKPFKEVTGPVKVVEAMKNSYAIIDVAVCIASAGTVRHIGIPRKIQPQ